jgi:hypothetical protein
MRLHLVHGDPDTDWGFYTACRERLARGLGIEPSQQTVALARPVPLLMLLATRWRAGRQASWTPRSLDEPPPWVDSSAAFGRRSKGSRRP